MKPIKMFGLATLLALLAMAFVGASSAMAESTKLCANDSESSCSEITHVHEVSVGKGTLLSSLVTIECEVLFLGDKVAGTSTPLKITGHFTYPMTGCQTTSGTLCEVNETSKEAIIEVLRTAHELAEVKGTAEVNAHCGSLINCTYDGEGLLGHGLGPLLSSSANGNVNISEQVTHKTGGTFCPKEAKLDLTTTPLSATYITPKMECIEEKEGLYTTKLNSRECVTDVKTLGNFELTTSGPMECFKLKEGLYEMLVNATECANDVKASGKFKLVG